MILDTVTAVPGAALTAAAVALAAAVTVIVACTVCEARDRARDRRTAATPVRVPVVALRAGDRLTDSGLTVADDPTVTPDGWVEVAAVRVGAYSAPYDVTRFRWPVTARVRVTRHLEAA